MGISWVGNFRVSIFRVGVFLGGNCPGGTYPAWEFSLVEVFRVGIVRWESSGWQFSRWEFSCYHIYCTLSLALGNYIPVHLYSYSYNENTTSIHWPKYQNSRLFELFDPYSFFGVISSLNFLGVKRPKM